MQPAPDLTTCEQEPVQWPGYIQSHGYLLALDPGTFTIWQASENLSELVNQSIADVIGKPLSALTLGDLPGSILEEILLIATRNSSSDAFAPYQITIRGELWCVLLHIHDGALLVELEPTGTHQLSTLMLLSQIMSDIQHSTTLTDLLHKTVAKVKSITGFDRVMVYRFNEDWHGEVVAEAREDYLEPFLGLHYPASDIPRQARELYKINLVRGIVDVNQPRIGIYPATYRHYNRPLDLTHASLRSVSPVHIEYLKNMGVQSSMSISLLNRGELWGLIACHHYKSPRFIDNSTRQSVKLISQVLSATVEIRQHDELSAFSEQLLDYEQLVHQQMIADWDVVQGLIKHPVTALDLTSATGMALLFEGQLHTLGDTPDEAFILELIDWHKATATETIFQTNKLPDLYPPAEPHRDKAAGVLMLTLSRDMNEYLLWFKPEQIKTVHWGGNPDKPVEITDDGQVRLSPRKSFDKWSQLVRNQSQPWQQQELSTVLKLREDLLQVVALKADQIRALNEKLRLAYEELEAFSYTVSHDLRAPLSSIKSYSEIYLEDYGSQMDESAVAIFSKVMKATDRMSELIRNVMQYSRLGRSELLTEYIAMEPLLMQIREEALAGEANRSVTITLGDTPDLYGDKTMIAQVFSNLISNAVKYSRHVPRAAILVRGYSDERDIIYAINDNGIGIDMKQAGKVFELFQRLDSAARYEGDGVGLAIVKRIVSRHRGKIWFESTLNQSTTFFVAFPKPLVD
ncbi:ATP-binding protein [Fibrella aquatica]|uniref:ATP-binding protein n=1 Tax=Fibrella aquatica TaxID=3242487 RepID=UPI00351FC205